MNLQPYTGIIITVVALFVYALWRLVRKPRLLEYTKAIAHRVDFPQQKAVIYFRKGSDSCVPFYFLEREDVNDVTLFPPTIEGCGEGFITTERFNFEIEKIIETVDDPDAERMI